jgi:hypothetical protein
LREFVHHEALEGVTTKDVDLFEIDRESLQTNVKRTRDLIARLRTGRSLTDAFLLSGASTAAVRSFRDDGPPGTCATPPVAESTAGEGWELVGQGGFEPPTT